MHTLSCNGWEGDYLSTFVIFVDFFFFLKWLLGTIRFLKGENIA